MGPWRGNVALVMRRRGGWPRAPSRGALTSQCSLDNWNTSRLPHLHPNAKRTLSLMSMLMFFSYSAKIRSLYALIYVKTTLERNRICLIDTVMLNMCHDLYIYIITITLKIRYVPLKNILIKKDNWFYFKWFKFYLILMLFREMLLLAD